MLLSPPGSGKPSHPSMLGLRPAARQGGGRSFLGVLLPPLMHACLRSRANPAAEINLPTNVYARPLLR